MAEHSSTRQPQQMHEQQIRQLQQENNDLTAFIEQRVSLVVALLYVAGKLLSFLIVSHKWLFVNEQIIVSDTLDANCCH